LTKTRLLRRKESGTRQINLRKTSKAHKTISRRLTRNRSRGLLCQPDGVTLGWLQKASLKILHIWQKNKKNSKWATAQVAMESSLMRVISKMKFPFVCFARIVESG